MIKYLQRQLLSISHRLKNLIDLSKEEDVKRRERLTENYNLVLELIEKLNDENYIVNNNELFFIFCEYIQFVEESKARERKQKQKNKELALNNRKTTDMSRNYKKTSNPRFNTRKDFNDNRGFSIVKGKSKLVRIVRDNADIIDKNN